VNYSPRSLSDRKRITKATYCKYDTYELSKGRAAAPASKNYAIQPGFSYSPQLGKVADVPDLVPVGFQF